MSHMRSRTVCDQIRGADYPRSGDRAAADDPPAKILVKQMFSLILFKICFDIYSYHM